MINAPNRSPERFRLLPKVKQLEGGGQGLEPSLPNSQDQFPTPAHTPVALLNSPGEEGLLEQLLVLLCSLNMGKSRVGLWGQA